MPPARPLYLDNAATSFPKPPEVREAILRFHDGIGASAGRGAYREAEEAGLLLARCRARLARILNAPDPARIVFTLNCTDALNLALKGALRPGDHVVTTWMDHNSVLRPLHALEARGIVSVTRVRADGEGLVDPEDVGRALRPGTRLVAMLHASNVSGGVQPVEAVGRLCRERGVLFLVDAAQTAGSLPLDLGALAIDLLALPGHKGLMGPLGTGALWIREGVDLATVREGGTGSRSEAAVQPEILPDRHEAGSHNLLGIAGLEAALAFVERVGIPAIAAHKRALVQRFLEGLSAIEGVKLHGPRQPERRTAVFSITFDGIDPLEAGRRLDLEHGLKVRAGLHCAPLAHRTLGTGRAGTVRLSPGWFTALADADRAIETVGRLAVGGARPACVP